MAGLKLKNKGDLVASINKDLLQWMDERVKGRKYKSRSHLIESILAQYKISEQC